MERFYGWELDRIEADILQVRDQGCPTCGHPVLNLPDIHVDIRDPTLPPFYGVNAGPICATCNTRKGPQTQLAMDCAEAERQAIARTSELRLGEQGRLF